MSFMEQLAARLVGIVRVLVPVVFLGLGVLAATALFTARETPPRVERGELASGVNTITVEPGVVHLDVEAFGVVQPSRTLQIQPQISGRVLTVNEQLQPGAVIPAGEVLVSIDVVDYNLALKQAQAGLATARFNLAVEEGRSRIARRDWELLGDIAGDLSSEASASELALRQPHLAEAQSAVAAAQSRVDKARLDVARGAVEAPFDLLVRSLSTAPGAMVGPASLLATAAGVDAWWVEVSVPMSELHRVAPAQSDARADATVHVRLPDGTSADYTGHVQRLMGTVDAAGRQARVLVQVDQPLEQARTRAVPLLLGAYVAVTLEGPPREGVYEVPRAVLREGEVVWVMGTDDRLVIREADVLAGSLDTVVLDIDLAPGERLVTSSIPLPLDGLLLSDWGDR